MAEIIYNRNLFYIKDLSTRVYENKSSTSTPKLMSVKLNLKPNTDYTVTSDAPLNASSSSDIFADTYPSKPSSATNGLQPNLSRAIKTSASGVIELTFRNASANATLYTNLTEIEIGDYRVKVEEGSEFTGYTPAPEDVLD